MEERFLVFDYTKKVECTAPMDHRKTSQAYEEKCEAPSSTLGLNVENEVSSIAILLYGATVATIIMSNVELLLVVTYVSYLLILIPILT